MIAQAIIAGRPYKTVNSLDRPKGIEPERKYRIRPLVTVRLPLRLHAVPKSVCSLQSNPSGIHESSPLATESSGQWEYLPHESRWARRIRCIEHLPAVMLSFQSCSVGCPATPHQTTGARGGGLRGSRIQDQLQVSETLSLDLRQAERRHP